MVGFRKRRPVAYTEFCTYSRYNSSPSLIPPRRMGEASLHRMKRRAPLVQAGQPEIRPGYTKPLGPTEIHFDIEDDLTQDVTYLFGMWIRQAGGEGRFKYILAERPEDEVMERAPSVLVDVTDYGHAHVSGTSMHTSHGVGPPLNT